MARTGYKMGDQELSLYGEERKVGELAPDFTLVKPDLSPVTLKDLGDKVKIIAPVPSIDTPVCELETIRFNEEAGKLGDDAVVLTVSMDLPFAQQRFCAAEGIKNAIVASDYQTHEFGKAYGVLINELKLLNRSIFILDGENRIVYTEVLQQNAEHPDYDKAIAAAKQLL